MIAVGPTLQATKDTESEAHSAAAVRSTKAAGAVALQKAADLRAMHCDEMPPLPDTSGEATREQSKREE